MCTQRIDHANHESFSKRKFVAVALDVILVTNKARDFAHYPGVRIENWLNG
ncbi:hypothetical protein PAMC26510_35290 [Caballeronia sordidicola]|uniref:Uncharacterized protein n=1 Tax=Caballeronia sordidicola TaxID=196367 RepID=A0A242M4W6_CABSO|nr:hypothetical protein PAMC26510_35290 [Caballeronia sordidicola]